MENSRKDFLLMLDERLEGFIKSLSERKACEWCEHPTESVLKSGLCSHCQRISQRVRKLEKEVHRYQQEKQPVHPFVTWNLRIARRKVVLAKAEGSMYRKTTLEILGLDLEKELCFLSKQLTGKQLFYGDATLLGESFSQNQRKFVFYLLSLIGRGYLRKTRRQQAGFEVALGEDQERG